MAAQMSTRISFVVIDLHTHTFLSDGVLLPEELVRRCEVAGYRGVVIADHVGLSNVEAVVAAAARLAESMKGVSRARVVAGAELTHVPPRLAQATAEAARKAGARIVVGHGETLAEPVAPGSNRAYIEAGVDLLAHPGLISLEDARLAAERGVCLEISTRRGHCYANGHVVRMSRETGAKVALCTDSHHYEDLVSREKAALIARGAGMTEPEIAQMFLCAEEVFLRGEQR